MRLLTNTIKDRGVVLGVVMVCAFSSAMVSAEPQVSAGRLHTVGLNTGGTVVAAGYDLTGWTDIVQVSAGDLAYGRY